MPFGDFESPDGRIARFEFPEGTTPEQAQEAMAGFDWNSLPKPSAMGAVKRGALNTYDLVSKALPGVAGSALGFDEYGGRKLQEAVSSMQDTAAQYPAKYESFDEVDSLGEFGGYATEAFLENVVSIIPSIATGGIGGIAAKGAIKQAAATAMANAAKAGATKEAAEAAAISAAKSAALKYQAAGAFAGSAVQNIPDSGVNLYAETGEVNPYAAIATGAGKAALDAVLPTKILQSGNVVGKPLGRVARGLGEGLVTEGLTEGAQQAMDQAAVSAITGDPFLTPENLKDVKEAAIKGGIAGGGMNAITSGVFGKSAPSRTPPVVPKTSPSDEPDEALSVPTTTPRPSPIEPGGIVQMGTYQYPIVAVDVAGQTATLYNDGSDGTEPGNQEVPIADIAPLVRKPSTAPVTPVTAVTPPTATQPTPAPKPMYTPPAKTEVAVPTTEQKAAEIIQDVSPENFKVDAKQYQFRDDADDSGVTDKLKPVKQWDKILADPFIIHERLDGTQYVADGHQRAGLLKRLRDSGQPVPSTVPAKILKESDGYTVGDARIIGAIKNISEGKATPIEAAKVLREKKNKTTSKVALPELTQNNAVLNQARELEKLNDDAWGMVVNGKVPSNHAQYVGRYISDPAQHLAVMDLLAKQKPANENQANTMVQLAQDAGFNTDTQTGLFGDEQVTQSLLKEESYLIDRAEAMIRNDEKLFKRISDSADVIESSGKNKLDTEANKARAEGDSWARQMLVKMARTKGSPIAAALKTEAKSMAEGGDKKAAVQRFVRAVRQESVRGPAKPDEKKQQVASEKSQLPMFADEKKLSDRELAEKKMNEPKRSAKRQDTDGFGLFDDGAPKQIDLEDAIATKKKSSGKSEASVLPKSEVSNEPTVDLKGRRAQQFVEDNRPSYRRQMYEAMGLDPAKAVNMAPEKIIEKAKPLFRNMFDIDVLVDPKANAGQVIDNLTDAYITFQYFAHAMGVPNKALGLSTVKMTPGGVSLNNRLKLEFKKSAGSALGLFNPASKKITIPRRSNSFAHEWGHALDYHVLDALGGNEGMEKAFRGFSARTREKGLSGFEPKSVADAWVNLMNTLFFDDAMAAAKILEIEKKIARSKSQKVKDGLQKQINKIKSGNYQGRDYRSPYYKSAKSIPGDTAYWVRPTEMLARAFEAYTASKVAEFGGSTEMLSRENIGYLAKGDSSIQKMYPQLADRARIFRALDQMMQAIRQAELLKTGNLNEANVANIVSAEEKLWPVLAEKKEKKSSIERAKEYFSEDAKVDRKESAKAEKAAREARGTNPVSVAKAGKDAIRAAVSSGRTYLRSIYGRNPTGTDMDNVLKAMATNPGSGEAQPGTYWDTVKQVVNSYSNKFEKIIDAYDIKLKSPDEQRFIWNAIQGLPQDVKLKPQREAALTKASADMRERIYNDLAYKLRDAGVDIGYLKDVGYLPQIFDMALITSGRESAIKDFTTAYEKKMEYERERGELDIKEFEGFAEQVLGRGDERVKALKEAVIDATEGDEIVMTDDLEDTIDALFDEVNELISPIRAESLMSDLMVGGDFSPDVSAGAEFAKSRSFPPTTLKLLAKWRVNNPIEATQDYITRAARKIAWEKHLGEIHQWKKNAVNKQGFNPEDAQTIQDTVELLTGRIRLKEARSTRNVLNRTLAHLTAMLLTRSVFASLAESHVMPLRTGRVRDGYRNMYNALKGIVGANDMKQYQETLEIAGVLESAMTDAISAERMGGSYDLDPNTQKFMSQFMENNIVRPLTRYQQLSAAVTGAKFFKDMAAIVTGGEGKALLESTTPESARAFFREMGVEKGKEKEFAEYVLSLEGLLPPTEDVGGGKAESPNAMKFMIALARFKDQVQQNPAAVDKPKWAATPYGKWVWALNAFNFAFWDNAIKSNAAYFRRINAEQGVGKAAMMTAAKFLPAYANYVMWMGMFFMLRTMLFAGEKWDEMDDDEKFNYILKGALSYSLPLGPAADAVYQSIEGVKYEKDLTSLTAGGPLGAVLSDIQAIIRSYQKNSEDTNTAERARVKAAYDLTVLPAVTQLMGMIPGPAGKVAGVAGAFATSGAAKDKAADIIAGEKEE